MNKIQGRIPLPGDKSISHRSALLAAIIDETSQFHNFNLNNDCRSTLHCLKQLGVRWQLQNDTLHVSGLPLENWRPSDSVLDAANSGTTARLLSGYLSNLSFPTQLVGDASLTRRPMKRVIEPLSQMGARIESNNGFLPLTFKPVHSLKGIQYRLPVASAQVKSALLLAGLFAEEETEVIETIPSRDHTERLLNLKTEDHVNGSRSIFSSKNHSIPNISMPIPGDFSSAAFFIAAALLLKGSELRIEHVSLNPTRTGLLDILAGMNAHIEIEQLQDYPEPAGNLVITYAPLVNTVIDQTLIPNIIDEIPILAVLATRAEGAFELHGAEELRFKESDRLQVMVDNLRSIGVSVDSFRDGMALTGPQALKGGHVKTHGDHRIAMAFAIANLLTDETIAIDDRRCVEISFPAFWDMLDTIVKP